MTESVPLAEGFAVAIEADWRAAVSDSSKDADLTAVSDDGIPIGPIYRRVVDTAPIVARPPGQKWKIVQRIGASDAGAALKLCAEEFAGGADGIALIFAGSVHPLPSALSPDAATAIAAGLKTMAAGDALLTIDAGLRTAELAREFVDLDCSLAFDPIAAVAAGRLAEAGAAVADLAGLAGAFHGSLALADGRIWHAAGASEAQELAAVLATVIELVRLFDAAGLAPGTAAQLIGVALATDSEQFLTIAKFRAARLLFGQVLGAAGIKTTLPIHAETAWRTMSRREPRMNVLRATGGAFAAATGGADSITVLPFDALEGAPGAQALRLARNTQLILAEESQLHRFADPAAGSGAVEALTDALAERAWTQFQAIEAEGGILRTLAGGTLQNAIAASRAARLARVAEGSVAMIGVNVYVAKTGEPLTARDPPRKSADGALVFTRLAEGLEAQA